MMKIDHTRKLMAWAMRQTGVLRLELRGHDVVASVDDGPWKRVGVAIPDLNLDLLRACCAAFSSRVMR